MAHGKLNQIEVASDDGHVFVLFGRRSLKDAATDMLQNAVDSAWTGQLRHDIPASTVKYSTNSQDYNTGFAK